MEELTDGGTAGTSDEIPAGRTAGWADRKGWPESRKDEEAEKSRKGEKKKRRKAGKKERRKGGKKERRKEGKKERRKEGKKERRKEGKVQDKAFQTCLVVARFL